MSHLSSASGLTAPCWRIPSISVYFSLLMGEVVTLTQWIHWSITRYVSRLECGVHEHLHKWDQKRVCASSSRRDPPNVHSHHLMVTSPPRLFFFSPHLSFSPVSTPRRLAAHHVRDDSKPRHPWRRNPESLLRVPVTVTGCSGPDCNWCQSDDGSHPPSLNRSISRVTADYVFYY